MSRHQLEVILQGSTVPHPGALMAQPSPCPRSTPRPYWCPGRGMEVLGSHPSISQGGEGRYRLAETGAE